MKKLMTAFLSTIMAVSLLAGCGSEVKESSAENSKASETKTAETNTVSEDVFKDIPDAITADVTIKGTPEMYKNVDFSKQETIYLYLIGSTPNDFDDILKLANEYLATFNTTLDITIMAWSDYQDLYSLNLTSGTNIDAIFTAPWVIYGRKLQRVRS